jgi:hypothetical protein
MSMANQFDREGRWANLRKAPKSSLKTRLALIVHQRGITEKQLEKFHAMRGGRFDYVAFAKKYNISLDWLSMGILAEHPRSPAPRREKRSSQHATPTEMREFGRLLGLLPESDRPWLSAMMRKLVDK